MAVVINTLSGKSGGVKIDNLSLNFDRPKSVDSAIFQISYKFEQDCFYLICFESKDYGYSLKAIYYAQSGENINSGNLINIPCLFLAYDFGVAVTYSQTTLRYNPELETLTLINASNYPINFFTELEEWEIYKIPLTVGF